MNLFNNIVDYLNKIANFVDQASFIRIWVRLNQSATLFVLIIAVVGFKLSYEKYLEDHVKMDEDRITKAWDIVTSMAGKKSNGGQINAIQILVKNTISLDHIDLQNTYLRGVNLKGASLDGANLNNADLRGANLQGASLRGANLSNVDLIEANLKNADLSNANLDYAKLYHANLTGTRFDNATLVNTKLAFATVDIGVILSKNLNNTDFTGVSFVLMDSQGNPDWDSYADTIAESSEADNAQEKINNSCQFSYYNKPNKDLPIKLSIRLCGGNINYEHIKDRNYDIE